MTSLLKLMFENLHNSILLPILMQILSPNDFSQFIIILKCENSCDKKKKNNSKYYITLCYRYAETILRNR